MVISSQHNDVSSTTRAVNPRRQRRRPCSPARPAAPRSEWSGGERVPPVHHHEAAAAASDTEDERGFLELQACIPHLAHNKAASRLDILLEAISYIDRLHTTLVHKLRRGEVAPEDRKILLAQYLDTIVVDANKEN